MSALLVEGTSPDLSELGAGFADPARGSQAVFRSVLQALSYPGQPVVVGGDAEWPVVPGAPCHAAGAAVLLALLDAETTLWLSPTLAGSAAETWLRFHTGCTVVSQPAQAQFVWAAHLAELPDLGHLCTGTDASPETAATCVVDVPAFQRDMASAHWALTGPGIRTTALLGLPGVSDAERRRFEALRSASHALFPRGIDVLLTTATHAVGLPRTTQLVGLAHTDPTPQEA
jgi:alpha-D-ribose 1-methylphosphonate 5-triphosphate synthase subunit PhnH